MGDGGGGSGGGGPSGLGPDGIFGGSGLEGDFGSDPGVDAMSGASNTGNQGGGGYMGTGGPDPMGGPSAGKGDRDPIAPSLKPLLIRLLLIRRPLRIKRNPTSVQRRSAGTGPCSLGTQAPTFNDADSYPVCWKVRIFSEQSQALN